MKCSDLRKLANLREQEALALFDARYYNGAYYLAGYAIECALKACIAKRVSRHEFPDAKLAQRAWSHELEHLTKVAELDTQLKLAPRADAAFEVNWAQVKDWRIQCRYDHSIGKLKAKDLLDAISNPTNGVLPWLRDRW